MQGEGPVGQPEVEDPGHLRVGRGRGPGEVGRMPVAVRPLRAQRGQRRPGAPDQRDQDLVEVLLPAASRQVGGQRGARGHQRGGRAQRVRRGDDLAGVHQHGGGPGGPPEVRGGQVQAGQRRARRVGVPQVSVGRPADRVAVQVDAVGDLVHLVAEVPAPQHRPPVGQPHHGRDRQPAGAQVGGELVLDRELLRGADADVVTLDEDRDVSVPDQRGGRHRPRAAPDDHGLAAEPARVTPAQDAEQLVVGERQPVGFGQLTAHAVNGVRALGQALRQRCSRPPATVIAAATANDRIEADIQLAGVKPMSWPNDVQADAHQDT